MSDFKTYNRGLTTNKYLFKGKVELIRPGKDMLCKECGSGELVLIDAQTPSEFGDRTFKEGDDVEFLIYPFISVFFGGKQ